MSDQVDLYRNWLGWVTTNLGRDARLAEIAAAAATDAAAQGQGFDSAAEAARIAWAGAAKRNSNDQRSMPASEAMPPPALGVMAAAGDGRQGQRAHPEANRGRSVFYTLVAVVVGILIYPVAGAQLDRNLGLFAPLVVTLFAGFALGLFSRSWRIATVCGWFIALLGLAGAELHLVPDSGIELDRVLALLVGGPGGAVAGGLLGARVMAANRVRTPSMLPTNSETAPAAKPDPENLRHYADWWFWATETLGGTTLRRRAAARAGMDAQTGGATVPSAVDSATRVFKGGSELASSSDDPAQRYAELYVRARLARRLDPEAAHALAAEAFSTWMASTDISTAISPRTNITAVVATVFLALTVAVLAVAFFGPIAWFDRFAPALVACVLGMFTFVIALFARSRIKYSGEAGGTIAGTSLGFGCFLAVVAGFAVLVLFFGALSGVPFGVPCVSCQ